MYDIIRHAGPREGVKQGTTSKKRYRYTLKFSLGQHFTDWLQKLENEFFAGFNFTNCRTHALHTMNYVNLQLAHM